MIRYLILLFVLPALTSCSMFSRSSSPAGKVAEYDVPYNARAGGQGIRKRLLVLPFLDVKQTRSEKVADVSRQVVVKELLRTRQFVIVNPTDFPHDPAKFLNEKQEYDLERIASIAAGMGIAAVVGGKILEVKAKRIGDEVGIFRKIKARVTTAVRIRVAAARNGRIIMDDVREGTVESTTTRVAEYSYSDRFLEDDPHLVRLSVTKAFAGTIGNIVKSVEKLSWEGRVALISGERVFVNAGRLSGIQLGDILKVMEQGEEVYDPDSGGFIGRAPGRMKGTIEVVSYFGKDGAIAIVHSGSGFEENDRVEIY